MTGSNTYSIFSGNEKRPFLVAGPCSAETYDQVRTAAFALKDCGVHLFRAGAWKPRTRPGVFQGSGEESLAWLRDIRSEFQIPVTTEVANARHAELALQHEIDVLWIGARTTANPFSVQEIADVLRGTNVPVMVKNPINPDLQLWLGAVERLEEAGITDMALVHRGFSFFNNKKYRNSPLWQIPIDMRSERPDLPLICDVSHISGTRALLRDVAQVAMDLAFDGLMVEVHPDPDHALSDAGQQIKPETFAELIASLHIRSQSIDNAPINADIEKLRTEIDNLDDRLVEVLADRMRLVREIGQMKNAHDIPILQPERWRMILLRAVERGEQKELTAEFIEELFKAVHQESIHHQLHVMNPSQNGLQDEK